MEDKNVRLRRAFLAALAWVPILGWVQASWAQTEPKRVGVLTYGARSADSTLQQWFEPFRRALADQGWIEGKNVQFVFASRPSGNPSQVAETAAEFVHLKVDVIWAPSAPYARAAYAATRTIPIVAQDFTSDPVAEGYVESYGRPGGNLTGVFLDAPEFAGKWFEILRGVVPGLTRVVVLWDPSAGTVHLNATQQIARSLRFQLRVVEVRTPDDIDKAFSPLPGRPQALIILPSPMMYQQSERLAQLTMKHRLPATSMARAFPEAGGAAAYGPDLASASERSAAFVARILGGAKPGDLPVERPTKVQLTVNLKSVEALGLQVPDSILYRADELIQ